MLSAWRCSRAGSTTSPWTLPRSTATSDPRPWGRSAWAGLSSPPCSRRSGPCRRRTLARRKRCWTRAYRPWRWVTSGVTCKRARGRRVGACCSTRGLLCSTIPSGACVEALRRGSFGLCSFPSFWRTWYSSQGASRRRPQLCRDFLDPERRSDSKRWCCKGWRLLTGPAVRSAYDSAAVCSRCACPSLPSFASYLARAAHDSSTRFCTLLC